jgi:hypothetical protein
LILSIDTVNQHCQSIIGTPTQQQLQAVSALTFSAGASSDALFSANKQKHQEDAKAADEKKVADEKKAADEKKKAALQQTSLSAALPGTLTVLVDSVDLALE